jgi:phosphomannomutase
MTTRALAEGATGSQGLVVSVSGVRGRVGESLTPEVMTRLAASLGAFLLSLSAAARGPGGNGERRVLVGRDSRTSGPMLRDAAVAGLLSVGCDVVDVGLSPTPTLLFGIKRLGAAGGMAITASHNPVDWNAAKLASPRGMFLVPSEGRQVIAVFSEGGPPRVGWDGVGAATAHPGFVMEHVERILGAPEVDPELVRARGFRIVLDACHGVGALLLLPLLERLGCRVETLYAEPTGRFPRNPEPLPAHLGELGTRVRESGADLGLAVDPDGDRLALVAETGAPVGEDLTLALAVERVLPLRGTPVVTNLSTSRVVQDAVERHGQKLVRTPVGEINVSQRMLELGSAIGGEGNGGVIYPAVHPTRDAGSAAGLILSLLASRGQTLSEVVGSLPRYSIVKEAIPLVPEDGVFDPSVVGGLLPPAESDLQDGLRLSWESEGAWLHVRASGTEPIARIIAEARSVERARELAQQARRAFERGRQPAARAGTPASSGDWGSSGD